VAFAAADHHYFLTARRTAADLVAWLAGRQAGSYTIRP
jgi:hypothetical protein